ncbi:MAG: preprotein translocase subunit SecA [Planctomycetota bacterium]
MPWIPFRSNRISNENRRRLVRMNPFVRQVKLRCKELEGQGVKQWRAQFEALRSNWNSPAHCSYSKYFVDATALAVLAANHCKGFQLHDVQIAGAAATASGSIIEMQTGEGKTIVCAVAALIRSVFDSSIHVATTSDYLAERDYAENVELFHSLGTTAGLLRLNAKTHANRDAYRRHITYGPGYLFGFDYLRDQVALRDLEQLVLGRDVLTKIHGVKPEDSLNQLAHTTIIVDEADSVLLDEATTPLILSTPPTQQAQAVTRAFAIAKDVAQVLGEEDYDADPQLKRIQLTESGINRSYKAIRYEPKFHIDRPWTEYVEQALYSQQFLIRNEDYVVQDGKIKLVDQHTGRIFEDRQLRNGLHQSVEAKEGVQINPPNQTAARLSRQRFFRLYENICGMTGTIQGSQIEVEKFYGSEVLALPPHHSSQRKQRPTQYFATAAAKLQAIVESVRDEMQDGRPILIGTRTIRESLGLFDAIKAQGLDAQVLNGLQNAEESEVIAQAGQHGALTIATNMAGRGTDIKLDPESKLAGGLHVIATQHHSSQRVDRQLIGRCARQGDPGSYQFFVSAEDQLFERHSKALGARLAESAEQNEFVHRDFGPQIAKLQNQIEAENFLLRQKLMQQDEQTDRFRSKLAGVVT